VRGLEGLKDDRTTERRSRRSGNERGGGRRLRKYYIYTTWCDSAAPTTAMPSDSTQRISIALLSEAQKQHYFYCARGGCPHLQLARAFP
jgi:hypothetical protein